MLGFFKIGDGGFFEFKFGDNGFFYFLSMELIGL